MDQSIKYKLTATECSHRLVVNMKGERGERGRRGERRGEDIETRGEGRRERRGEESEARGGGRGEGREGRGGEEGGSSCRLGDARM